MVDLDPSRGAEANKYRPAVIVSNDGANTTAERSNTTSIYPCQVLLRADSTGLPRDSKAQVEPVRSVDVELVGTLVGTLDGEVRGDLDDARRLHVAL